MFRARFNLRPSVTLIILNILLVGFFYDAVVRLSSSRCARERVCFRVLGV